MIGWVNMSYLLISTSHSCINTVVYERDPAKLHEPSQS